MLQVENKHFLKVERLEKIKFQLIVLFSNSFLRYLMLQVTQKKKQAGKIKNETQLCLSDDLGNAIKNHVIQPDR